MKPPLTWALEHPELLVGWVEAKGVEPAPSSEKLLAELRRVVGNPDEHGLTDEVRVAVRDLLRGRGYKPAGRGKPASEFLVGAAARGAFPEINNVVDINNLVSLSTGWPASVFDQDAAGDALELRFGAPGEAFVFNDAGQSIDIGGLVCVARRDGDAIGNPVKDSMATKIIPTTTRVLAVVYTARTLGGGGRLQVALERFGSMLQREARATAVRTGFLPAEGLPENVGHTAS